MVKTVVAQLLPAVIANTPEVYKRFGEQSESQLIEFLTSDISAEINAEDMIQSPNLKVIYKGITYQSVQSPDFMKKLDTALTNGRVPASMRANLFRESNAALEVGGKLH